MEPSPQRHLNGYSVDLYTRVHVVENDTNILKGDLKEIKQDVSALKTLAHKAIGAGIALGVVWTIATFVIAIVMKS